MLAEKTGCSVITISRWENGHTVMSVVDIIKVAQALKVSTNYLLGIAKSGQQEVKIIPDLSTEQKNFVIDTVRALMELL